jgi:hypothetical protein
VTVSKASKAPKAERVEIKLAPRAARSPIGKMLDDGEFPVSCELNPPRSSNFDKILQQVKMLKAAGVKIVNIPDGPRPRPREPHDSGTHRDAGTGIGPFWLFLMTVTSRMQSDFFWARRRWACSTFCRYWRSAQAGDYPMATAVLMWTPSGCCASRIIEPAAIWRNHHVPAFTRGGFNPRHDLP